MAWLWTRENAVHSLRMTLRHAPVPARIQAPVASEPAPSFGAVCRKLLRLRDLNLGLGVTRAAKSEGRADGILEAQHAEHGGPHGNVGVGVRIADEVHAVLGAAEEDVDAILRPQEADTVSIVAANERNENDFGLFVLKVVDSGDAEEVVEGLLFEERFAALG